MHQAIKSYTEAARPLPPDPCLGDLCVHRVDGESVYSVLPMTQAGRSFLFKHHDAGSAHGDLLLVPRYNIVSLCDAMFDSGLVVV